MTDAAVGETCGAPENGPCFVMGRRRSGRPPFAMGRRRGLRAIAFLKERESMMVRERIEALRERMRREGMDVYLVRKDLEVGPLLGAGGLFVVEHGDVGPGVHVALEHPVVVAVEEGEGAGEQAVLLGGPGGCRPTRP